MSKTLLIILSLMLFFSCEKFKKDDYNELGINPGYGKSINNTGKNITLKDSLSIKLPFSSPVQYLDSYIYNDSLFFGIHNSNKIDVFNLLSQKHIKTLEFNEYEIGEGIFNVYVKSLDSIYITNYYPPKIHHINYENKLINTISPGTLQLDINNEKVPKNVVNYRFPISLSYQKPSVNNNLMYIAIEPIGASKHSGFRETQRIGVFDLNKSKWLKSICKPEGIMSLEGVFFNHDLMNPFFVRVEQKLYVTYPMSHYVYIYSLDGDLIDKKLVSSSFIEETPTSLNKNDFEDKQKAWNYRIQTPFYGPLFYHKKAGVFSRIFHQEQNLYKIKGILNDGSKRKGYVLYFDKNLKKIGEYEFKDAKLGIGKVTPFDDGLLIGRSNFYWENEDEFIKKFIYKFEKKNKNDV